MAALAPPKPTRANTAVRRAAERWPPPETDFARDLEARTSFRSTHSDEEDEVATEARANPATRLPGAAALSHGQHVRVTANRSADLDDILEEESFDEGPEEEDKSPPSPIEVCVGTSASSSSNSPEPNAFRRASRANNGFRRSQDSQSSDEVVVTSPSSEKSASAGGKSAAARRLARGSLSQSLSHKSQVR